MSDPIRILVADDHLIIRQGLRLILETEPDLLLVGEASDGAEALDLVDKFHPDVVLMDLRMPGMDGLTAIRRLRDDHPDVAVVILTTFNEDELMRKGLGLGARGYLLKDTDRGSLFNTIRAAARGETLLKPEILEKLLENKNSEAKSVETESDIELTDREIEVLVAVAKGERSKEIAYKLGITERTVKAHLSNIYSKLGVDSRAAAVSEAMRRGWLPDH
jgi:NarL family two-component system response regulator YdfI